MRAIAALVGFALVLVASPALAQPAPIASQAVPAGQLGDQVRPVAYRLDLTIDPAQVGFSGTVEIDAVLRAASARVFLHGRDLTMRRAEAVIGGAAYPGTWTQLEDSGTAALSFAQPLPPGPVTLRFDYAGTFNSGPSGLFRVKVGDQWYSWSQFESIDARAAFPGFDQPGFKTPFTLTLRTPPGLMAVSNAPESGVSREGGLDVHRFAPTLPLPTYLVAMMVGPFASVADAVPPTPQRPAPLPRRVISPRPNADRLSFALANTKPIVSLLEAYFGQPFPFPKLDQITAPIMPGAMENAGADNYADHLIVMTEDAPVPQKRNFGMVVAHELAHQWFGDLVTPAWWDDIWLNESFANWMGYRIADQWRPDLHIGSGANAEGFAAMNTDALLAGRPIHQAITANREIDAAFDSITYGKGGHVVAMIAAFMGDDRFRDGVRQYMAAHRYGNASSAQFFAAMAQVAGDPRILPAMQSFTDQQGVPLLTFTRTAGGYAVAQSRYARLGTTAPQTLWGVPLCVRKGTERKCQLLDSQSGALEIKGPGRGSGAFMPNAGGTGYYRFELPRRDWNALIATASHLSGNEALALSDSLIASFLAGRASAGQLAALAVKLAANPDSHASGVALRGMETLRRSGLLDDRAMLAYRKLVARLYGPRLDGHRPNFRVGAYAREDAEALQRRSDVIAALDGVAKTLEIHAALADAAEAWLGPDSKPGKPDTGGDRTALDPMWYDDAFGAWLDRAGHAGAGLAGAKRLMALAVSSQDPVLRPTLLAAVGGSGNAEIARWLLDLADEKSAEAGAYPGLRLNERLGLVRDITASAGTQTIGYDWVKAHLDALLGGSGGIFFASRMPQMLGGFCSVAMAEAFASDLRPRLTGSTGRLELERTIERVRDCGILQAARKGETSREIAKLLP